MILKYCSDSKSKSIGNGGKILNIKGRLSIFFKRRNRYFRNILEEYLT